MNRLGKLLRGWAALGLATWASLNTAQAALIVDLQATNAIGATLSNSKTITEATVGAVISFNIVAQVTGVVDGSTTNDGLSSFAGGFYTQNGGALRGNVQNVLLKPAFSGSGSAIGAANNGLNLGDNDGDIDWGGTSNTSSSGWFSARGTSVPVIGTSFVVGTLELQLTSVTPGDMTFNFVPRIFITSANWLQDGQTLSPSTGTFTPGTAVTISTVPEPGTLALGGMLGAGLAGWKLRRKKK